MAEAGAVRTARRWPAGWPASPSRIEAELVEPRPQLRAGVLGFAGPDDIEPGRVFKDIGFDSLTAVELRNRLQHGHRVRLPATMIFDYPTPTALARFLSAQPVSDRRADTGDVVPTAAVLDDDPVVIVGMSCRFPGGAETPNGCGTCSRATGTPSPASRPTAAGTWSPCSTTTRTTRSAATRGKAASSPRPPSSNAAFFGINPRESMSMDRSTGWCWRRRGRR